MLINILKNVLKVSPHVLSDSPPMLVLFWALMGLKGAWDPVAHCTKHLFKK